MTDRRRESVRVFREAGPRGRLVLDDGARLLDLTDHLQGTGQPSDLVGLFETGWFDEGELRPRLFGDDPKPWKTLEIEWDGNALPEVNTPIDRRSVGKILCLGKNFREHAEEFGEEVPAEPMFFNKLPELLTPHRAEVTVPSWYQERVDHEAELCVVIGLGGLRDPGRGRDGARRWLHHRQRSDRAVPAKGATASRAIRGCAPRTWTGFCPLGPCFVPRDFLDVSDLRVRASVGGVERQNASTKDFVVNIPTAIAWLSRHLTLRPGDLILTGTPAGVGPLVDGDEVVCSIDGIGALATRIRRSPVHG